MIATLRTFFDVLLHGTGPDEAHVHFHRGPEGHPAVCHDEWCPKPRLSV
jgi:hypothetical protein